MYMYTICTCKYICITNYTAQQGQLQHLLSTVQNELKDLIMHIYIYVDNMFVL